MKMNIVLTHDVELGIVLVFANESELEHFVSKTQIPHKQIICYGGYYNALLI